MCLIWVSGCVSGSIGQQVAHAETCRAGWERRCVGVGE